jgi:acetyltransferase-like isoleucine patch superfamily enzyme
MLGSNTTIFGAGGLVVGKGVVIGENVHVMSSNYSYYKNNPTMLPFSLQDIKRNVRYGIMYGSEIPP